MLGHLGWSCDLTLSKVIQFWEKSEEWEQTRQDHKIYDQLKLLSGEGRGDEGNIGFFGGGGGGKTPVEHRNSQRQKQLNLQYINTTAHWFWLCCQHSRLNTAPLAENQLKQASGFYT